MCTISVKYTEEAGLVAMGARRPHPDAGQGIDLTGGGGGGGGGGSSGTRDDDDGLKTAIAASLDARRAAPAAGGSVDLTGPDDAEEEEVAARPTRDIGRTTLRRPRP